jgi:hypothetical protein
VALVDQSFQRLENARVRGRRTDAAGDAIEQRRVAGDRPCVEERQQELRVVDFEPGEVADLPDLVADREPRVPHRVQDRADPFFLRLADLAVEEQQDVEVGMQAELTPAIAAERDDEARVRRWRRGVEQPLQELVDRFGKAPQRRSAALAARGRGRQRLPRAFHIGERRRHWL